MNNHVFRVEVNLTTDDIEVICKLAADSLASFTDERSRSIGLTKSEVQALIRAEIARAQTCLPAGPVRRR